MEQRSRRREPAACAPLRSARFGDHLGARGRRQSRRIGRGLPEFVEIAAVAASEVEDAPRVRDLIGDRIDDRGAPANVVFAVAIALRETPEILRDIGTRAPRERWIIVSQVHFPR